MYFATGTECHFQATFRVTKYKPSVKFSRLNVENSKSYQRLTKI